MTASWRQCTHIVRSLQSRPLIADWIISWGHDETQLSPQGRAAKLVQADTGLTGLQLDLLVFTHSCGISISVRCGVVMLAHAAALSLHLITDTTDPPASGHCSNVIIQSVIKMQTMQCPPFLLSVTSTCPQGSEGTLFHLPRHVLYPETYTVWWSTGMWWEMSIHFSQGIFLNCCTLWVTYLGC